MFGSVRVFACVCMYVTPLLFELFDLRPSMEVDLDLGQVGIVGQWAFKTYKGHIP